MEDKTLQKKKFNFPSSPVILFVLICIVAFMTYLIPAGQFDTVMNPDTGTAMVDASTYHQLEQTPVNPFRMFVAIKEGFLSGAQIIFLILFGYYWVYSVMQTGAFTAMIHRLLSSKIRNSKLLVPIVMFVFALAGSTYGEFETVYGLIPIFIALAIALGYDALVGMAMCGMAVAVGFASATTNPFTIGIAQSYGELPLFSGLAYRWVIFCVFVPVAILWVSRYANKIKADPTKSYVYGLDYSAFSLSAATGSEEITEFTTRHKLLMLGMIATVITIVFGSLKLGWYINEMSAVFLISGILSSIVAGKGPEQMATNLITACSEMTTAMVVVGMSRAILVILQNGNIIDTVIYGMYIPMQSMPSWVMAEMMLFVQNMLNFFIPSGSGQAAAIMPIMIPLADLAGLNRQVAVLAYQFGDGFSNLIWPTGACAIMCGIAKIPLDRWYRFFLPLFGIMFLLQSAFVILAVFINYGPF